MNIPPLRVYLVEDSLIMFKVLRELVEGAGAEVVGHSVGAPEALHEIDKTVVDVVIVDIGLTDGNGFEVVQALANRASRPIIYVLSNHVAPPFRARASELGADAFFSKDREMASLVASVATLAYGRPVVQSSRSRTDLRQET